MIDLHCHILPGVDDGARDLAEAVAMARMAVEDGVEVVACTPHFLPGVYENDGPDIRERTASLQAHLADLGIGLALVTGGDVHVAPDLVGQLRGGRVLSLADTRYVLVEPPHDVLPPRIDLLFLALLAAGYVPILTHPERMKWVEAQTGLLRHLAGCGVLLQVTAGALVGSFGRRARYWSEWLLDRGLVALVASDAHDLSARPPGLSQAHQALVAAVGREGADAIVIHRPRGILADMDPAMLPPLPGAPRGAAVPFDRARPNRRSGRRNGPAWFPA